MLEPLEHIFDEFRKLGKGASDLITWLTGFGLIVLILANVRLLISLSRAFKLYFVRQQSKCCTVNLSQSYGKWAVVTGATHGIGLALARELARRGMSLVIIARNEERLLATKQSLEREPNAGEVVVVLRDFCDTSEESHKRMVSELEPYKRDIGILVNNVGIYSLEGKRFAEIDEQELRNTVNVNLMSSVLMTRALMPSMIERGKGMIINVSSLVGSLTAPYFGVYAGSKAFIDSFSRQLSFEYRRIPGIKVVNLTTGPVNTKPETRAGFFVASTQQYAQSVLNIIGKGSPAPEFAGLAGHALIKRFGDSLERFGLYAPLVELLFKNQGKVGPVVQSSA